MGDYNRRDSMISVKGNSELNRHSMQAYIVIETIGYLCHLPICNYNTLDLKHQCAGIGKWIDNTD